MLARPGRLAPRPVVVVALVTAACLLGDSALYVLLPSNLESFAVSPTGAGAILGINRYIRVVSNAMAGRAYERVGFRPSLIAAIVLAGATTISYGFFNGFWLLFIAHGLWGVAYSFLRLGGYLAVVGSGLESSYGRLMGVLLGVSRAGSLLAVLAGGLLSDASGNRPTFVIFGLISLTALSLVPFTGLRGISQTQTASSEKSGTRAGSGVIVDSPDNLKIVTMYAGAGVVWMTSALIVGTAGYLVRTVAGDGVTVLGMVIGVGTLAGVLVAMRWVSDLGLSPVLGYMSDTLGRSRVILSAMTVSSASLALVALSQSLIVVIPCFGAMFVATTALIVSLNASIGGLASVGGGTKILSRYATWADVGSGTGPLMGLPLVTTVGFGWTYGGAAVLMMLAAFGYRTVFAKEMAVEPL